MRLSYYKFPEGTDEKILLENGCPVILKNGSSTYVDSIPDERRNEVNYVSTICGPASITWIKNAMKKWGGSGFTEHYDRDGGMFEVSEIILKGNNSTFTYNHHL